jgi:hypothetical protein
MAITGGCLCEAVRYEVRGDLLRAGSCHCSMCRKAHGAAFGTYAEVPEGGFRWTRGEDLVRVYASSPEGGRAFCSRCGSTLGAVEKDELRWLTLGTVDGDPGIRPQAHIFVASKAPWDEINDDLPRFDEYPPET